MPFVEAALVGAGAVLRLPVRLRGRLELVRIVETATGAECADRRLPIVLDGLVRRSRIRCRLLLVLAGEHRAELVLEAERSLFLDRLRHDGGRYGLDRGLKRLFRRRLVSDRIVRRQAGRLRLVLGKNVAEIHVDIGEEILVLEACAGRGQLRCGGRNGLRLGGRLVVPLPGRRDVVRPRAQRFGKDGLLMPGGRLLFGLGRESVVEIAAENIIGIGRDVGIHRLGSLIIDDRLAGFGRDFPALLFGHRIGGLGRLLLGIAGFDRGFRRGFSLVGRSVELLEAEVFQQFLLQIDAEILVARRGGRRRLDAWVMPHDARQFRERIGLVEI